MSTTQSQQTNRCVVCGIEPDIDEVHWLHEEGCIHEDGHIDMAPECDCDVIACEKHCPKCAHHEVAGQFAQEYFSVLRLANSLASEFMNDLLAPWMEKEGLIISSSRVANCWHMEDRSGETISPEDLPEWLVKILDVEVIPGFDPPLVFGSFMPIRSKTVDVPTIP